MKNFRYNGEDFWLSMLFWFMPSAVAFSLVPKEIPLWLFVLGDLVYLTFFLFVAFKK